MLKIIDAEAVTCGGVFLSGPRETAYVEAQSLY